MRTDKEQVLQLRKLGKSYNEIRQKIRIPKSTLSEWLCKIDWSRKIKRVLIKKAKKRSAIHLRKLDKIRGVHLARIYQEAIEEAKEEFEYLKFYPLFIAGISLYWGEGDKSSKNLIRVGNVDPLLIKLFVKFLQKVCGIPQEKIRAWILLYPDLNPEECKEFWIKKCGLKEINFTKSIVIHGRHKTKRLQYGVCTVGTNSTYLKKKILKWLILMSKELNKEMYYPRP